MDIIKMLDTLRGEMNRISEAIVVLERLAMGQGKRRGRPPNWMKGIRGDDDKGRGKKKVRKTSKTKAKRSRFSAATRRKMSAAQKLRWSTHRSTHRSTRRRVVANG
jgi:hypothetical protein